MATIDLKNLSKLIVFSFTSLLASLGYSAEISTDAPKAELMTIVDAEHARSFYCDCAFDRSGITENTKCHSDGLKQKKEVIWTSLIKLSAENLGGNQESLTRLNADLQLIMPLLSEDFVLGDDYRFGEVEVATSQLACGISLDDNNKLFEPPAAKKGNVARIVLYLHENYQYELSQKEIQVFLEWQELDKVETWEAERNRWLEILQGKSLNISTKSIPSYLESLKERNQHEMKEWVQRNYSRIVDSLNEPEWDVLRVYFDVKQHINIGLDLWIFDIVNGRDSWADLYEAYDLYTQLAKHSRHKIGGYDIEIFGKMFSLAIIFAREDDARWYGEQLLYFLEREKLYDYHRRYASFYLGLANLVVYKNWLAGDSIVDGLSLESTEHSDIEPAKVKLMQPYKNLFWKNATDYQRQSSFQRASNAFFDEYSLALPAHKLFQVELLAYEQMRITVGEKEILFKPELFNQPFLRLPPYSTYKPTRLSRQLSEKIAQLDPIPSLHQAVENRDFDEIDRLLKQGETINQYDRDERTPLSIAVKQDNKAIVEKLLTAQKLSDQPESWQLIHASNLIAALNLQNSEMAKLLLKHGLDPNRNSLNQNALQLMLRDYELAQDTVLLPALLVNGANPNTTTGDLPLDLALSNLYGIEAVTTMVELFVENGADIKLSNALCYESIQDQSEVMRYLLAKGLDPNKIWYSEIRPLHCAADADMNEAVIILLEAGADPSLRNYSGERPADIARERGNRGLVEIFNRYQAK